MLPHTLIRAAEMTNAVLEGLKMIETLTGKTFNGSAGAALAVIRSVQSIVTALVAGMTDKTIDAGSLVQELNKLKTELAINDALADSELDKKFPTG